MGQTKRRGTFEQRRNEAILRNSELKQERKTELVAMGGVTPPRISPLLGLASILAMSGYYDYVPLPRNNQRKGIA